jgi:pantoate--beta-alanine ligase
VSAPSLFPNWRISPGERGGKIFSTRDFVLPGRRSGPNGERQTKIYAFVSEVVPPKRPIDVRIVKIVSAISEVPAPAGKRVLVPTMGALHKAHGELMRVAREHAGEDGEVTVSIFVNPLQFEPGADFDRYPRPEKADEELCRKAGVNLLFRPPGSEIYAEDASVTVDESELSNTLEGKSRPGHFRGVCTVVAKLFHILAPDTAIFGEKDFQQLAIVRRMVRDLNFPIRIAAVPTVREADGLACSSRNRYLTSEERAQAPVLRASLLKAQELVRSGKRASNLIVDVVRALIEKAPLARIDYVDVVNSDTLRPVETAEGNARLVLAVYFGKTRLIDNILLE